MHLIQKYLRITAYLKIAITATELSTIILVENKAQLSALQCITNRDVAISISKEARVSCSEFSIIFIAFETFCLLKIYNLLKNL